MATPSPPQTATYLLPQSVIPRGFAYLVDTLIVAVLCAILMAAGVLQGGDLKTFDPSAMQDVLESNAGFAIYVILFAYFLLCEGAWGQTAGKRLLGLRVVRVTDGSPCGWSRSMVRNLIRPFDLLFVGLPGAIVVLVSPTRQRVGDMAGGTLVVRQITIPVAMATVIPRLLRRCGSCGRLAPATGPCPGCAAAPPQAPSAPAAAPFAAAMLQPLAGMMAIGEAAAGFRGAAQEVLSAEVAYGDASTAESARLLGVSAAAEAPPPVSGASEPGPGSVTAEAEEDASPEATAEGDEAADPTAAGAGHPDDGEDTSFVDAADAQHLSDEYVAAWRRLMGAVETLRSRRTDLDAALSRANVSLAQVRGGDALLAELLDEVEPYLDAGDDEAVLAAFMSRSAPPPGEGGVEAPADLA